MNNFPTEQLANKELITQVLQETLSEKPWPTACQCHWIDSNKFRILLWKDKDTYILKIAEQKFVGVARQKTAAEKFTENFANYMKVKISLPRLSLLSLNPLPPSLPSPTTDL